MKELDAIRKASTSLELKIGSTEEKAKEIKKTDSFEKIDIDKQAETFELTRKQESFEKIEASDIEAQKLEENNDRVKEASTEVKSQREGSFEIINPLSVENQMNVSQIQTEKDELVTSVSIDDAKKEETLDISTIKQDSFENISISDVPKIHTSGIEKAEQVSEISVEGAKKEKVRLKHEWNTEYGVIEHVKQEPLEIFSLLAEAESETQEAYKALDLASVDNQNEFAIQTTFKHDSFENIEISDQGQVEVKELLAEAKASIQEADKAHDITESSQIEEEKAKEKSPEQEALNVIDHRPSVEVKQLLAEAKSSLETADKTSELSHPEIMHESVQGSDIKPELIEQIATQQEPAQIQELLAEAKTSLQTAENVLDFTHHDVKQESAEEKIPEQESFENVTLSSKIEIKESPETAKTLKLYDESLSEFSELSQINEIANIIQKDLLIESRKTEEDEKPISEISFSDSLEKNIDIITQKARFPQQKFENESISDLIAELSDSKLAAGYSDIIADSLIETASNQAENLTIEQTIEELIDQYGNFIFTTPQKVPQQTEDQRQVSSIESDNYIIVNKTESESEARQVPNIATAVDEQNKAPRFTQRLSNQEFFENDNLHLDCYVIGAEPIMIKWFHNDKLIEPKSDRNIEIYRELGICSLEILSTSIRYQGEYKCHASNEYGFDLTTCMLSMINASKKTRFEENVEFFEPLRDQAVDIGTEAFLDCSVRNIRKSDQIEWYFNHNLIELNPSDKNLEIFTELGVCSLQIRKMKPELAGFYSCKVSDIDGRILAQTGCYLNVKEGSIPISILKDDSKLTYFQVLPYFVNELNNLVVLREGDTINLLCRLNDDSEPKPSIFWLKDNKDITFSKHYKTKHVSKTGECRLVVENCDKHFNQGVYSCVATVPNMPDHIIAKTSCKVKIRSSDESTTTDSSSDEKSQQESTSRGIAPMFLQSLEDTELEEGEDLEIKCQIMGAPIPEIACYFTRDVGDKNSIKKIKSDYISYNCENGICRITLKNVTNSLNDGFYMVKAYNDAGALTTACRVIVKQKTFPPLNLEADCEPKFIMELPTETKVMDGQEITLTSLCAAKPQADIKWLRSKLESPEDFYPVTETSDLKSFFDVTTGKCCLKISDTYPQDAGFYKCIATNPLGKAETKTQLTVECNLKNNSLIKSTQHYFSSF